ncbi:MAG: helix-turn-helix domain-containing protein [Pseudomonadales bacterium]
MSEPVNHVASKVLGPMLVLLEQELARADITRPDGVPVNGEQFAQWYLAAVQALEVYVAERDNHPPVTNRDIQMMCRCALTALTLGEAIDLVGDFADMLAPRCGATSLTLLDDQTAIFKMDSYRNSNDAVANLVDITGLYAFYQLFQWLVAAPLPLRQVGLGPCQREDVMPLLNLFGAPALASGPLLSLTFDTRWLAAPVARRSAELTDFLAHFPCSIFHQQTDSLAEQVATLIGAHLDQQMALPSQADIAATLQLAQSTMRRKLQQAGTGFRRLRDQCLYERACECLADENLTIEEISRQLMFADTTAFSRAFKHWSAESPTAWRRRHFTSSSV